MSTANDPKQRHIQNPVKHLRWNFSQKQLTAKSRKLFSQKTPSYKFDRLLNTLLQKLFISKRQHPLYVVRCAIWYYLHNLKNVKNTHGGVLILALKLTLLRSCFSRLLNCTNGTKSRNAPHTTPIKNLKIMVYLRQRMILSCRPYFECLQQFQQCLFAMHLH